MATEENDSPGALTEEKDGVLVYLAKAGASSTYYPRNFLEFDVEELEAGHALGNPGDEKTEAAFAPYLQGVAKLDAKDLAIIGADFAPTKSLKLQILPDDTIESIRRFTERLKKNETGKDESLFWLGKPPLGTALLGFSEADWEVRGKEQYWLSCYLPKSSVSTICAAVNAKRVRGVRMELRLRGLYTDEAPVAPRAFPGRLFLRPKPSQKLPEIAAGFVTDVIMKEETADLRAQAVSDDEGQTTDDGALQAEVQPDSSQAVKSANAELQHSIMAVASNLDSLRALLKFYLFLIVLLLAVLVFR